MKTSRFILALLVVVNLSCLNDDEGNITNNGCIIGQGTIVMETRTLPDFHNITVAIFGEVLLTQGPLDDIIIEAQSNVLQELKTEVVNEELIISTDQCVDIVDPIRLQISIPEIKSLTLAGVGDITAQNDFDLTELSITLAGVGSFTLRGTTNTLDITQAGLGSVQAFNLNTDICDITIAGTGDAEVFVNDELNVVIAGTGTVFYKGNPTITSTISGTGAVVNSN